MIAQLFSIMAPILICAGVGYIWARRKLPFDGDFVSRLVMNVTCPCLIIATLGQVALDASLLLQLGSAAVCILAVSAAAFYLTLKVMGLDFRTYLPSLVFPNCGNVGLPLCFFAFGQQGLAMALCIFIFTTCAHFTLGVAMSSGQAVWREAIRSPVIVAAIIAVMMIMTGYSLPVWLNNSVTLLGNVSIPLMLIALGVSLADLRVEAIKISIILSFLRLMGGFGLGLAVSEIWQFEGVMRGVLIVEFAMPAAVFNYMLALRYQRSPQAVAGVVVSSTLMSFASMPLLLWFVL